MRPEKTAVRKVSQNRLRVKKVLMLVYSRYPLDPRVRREAEFLAENGYTIDVLCLRASGEKREEVINGVGVMRINENKYSGASKIHYFASYLSFFFKALVVVTTLHLRERYNVVQVHTMPDFLIFAAVVPKILGAKLVIDVHDLMPELFGAIYNIGANHGIFRALKLVERLSIAFADRAIAVSKPHLGILVEHGNNKAKFITLLNSPNERIFTRAINQKVRGYDCFSLVYHGTVEKRYGLDLAIRAVALLKRRGIAMRMTIIGQGEEVGYLQELVASLGLDNIEFLKLMAQEDLVPIIQNADLAIIPIVLNGFTRYAIPTKLFEYVTLGIPVVVGRLPSIEYYFDDDMVCFFKPGDVNDLKDKIFELYKDGDKRRALVLNSFEAMQEYRWAVEQRNYLQLLTSLDQVGNS